MADTTFGRSFVRFPAIKGRFGIKALICGDISVDMAGLAISMDSLVSFRGTEFSSKGLLYARWFSDVTYRIRDLSGKIEDYGINGRTTHQWEKYCYS